MPGHSLSCVGGRARRRQGEVGQQDVDRGDDGGRQMSIYERPRIGGDVGAVLRKYPA